MIRATKKRSRLLLAAFAGAAVLTGIPNAHAAIARDAADAAEVASIRAVKPEAADLLERGEALALDGRLREALPLFAQVKDAVPDAALPRRRICETMTALGHGAEALPACYAALQIAHTNVGVRAIVRALVVGPDAPPIARLEQAMTLLTLERKRAGMHVALSSALCDVAERIGDGIMLQHCAEELSQLDPAAPETKHALSLLAARCPPARFWAGWIAIGVAILGTLAHAARQRRGRGVARRLPPALGMGVVLFGLLLAVSSPAVAAGIPKPPGDWLSKWPVDDANPEGSVPTEEQRNKDPLQFGYWLQDALLKGEIASKKEDYVASVKYYRAVAKAVPDRSFAFTRMCDGYDKLGERELAIASCLSALSVDGVRYSDYARYVHLVLAKPTGQGLNKGEEDALSAVLDRLKTDDAAHPLVDQLECEVGTYTANLAELEECTANLAKKTPDDADLPRYQFALALRKGDLAGARRLADQVEQTAGHEGTQGMENALALAIRRHTRSLFIRVGGALLVFLSAVLATLYIKKRRTSAAPGAVTA